MGKQKLKGKDLRKIGYRSDQQKSLAINLMAKYYKHLRKSEQLDLLTRVLESPEAFQQHENLSILAEGFMEVVEKEDFSIYQLKEEKKPLRVYGKKFIDANTLRQMETALRLPVAVEGALMPDAHVGYGLPVGGVLSTKNEIIPYGIGLDIGCRMSLTILDVPGSYLLGRNYAFKNALKQETYFGVGKIRDKQVDHAILDDTRFQSTELLQRLHGKAIQQLGTSGSGNHFVEFGEVEIQEENNLDLPSGNYLGILSHSGSRGVGALIAQYYTKVAMDKCRLPQGAKHLAWLDLDKEEGQEYWLSMQLAGDFAKACHDVIHYKLMKELGLKPLMNIENHHNFAWKETMQGEEFIVHRKGATPAGEGDLGIIPGSMTASGYIVRGKGSIDSLQSAAHGAGRQLSRSKARDTFTKSSIKSELKSRGITLLGGGVDEAPGAYKNIETVMQAQTDLVSIEGKFTPKIVRMNKD